MDPSVDSVVFACQIIVVGAQQSLIRVTTIHLGLSSVGLVHRSEKLSSIDLFMTSLIEVHLGSTLPLRSSMCVDFSLPVSDYQLVTGTFLAS